LLRFERLDLRLHQHQSRHLAFDPRTQGHRQRRPVAILPTGERTALDYLLRPLTDSLNRAFRVQ
jgi:hypothetical protein